MIFKTLILKFLSYFVQFAKKVEGKNQKSLPRRVWRWKLISSLEAEILYELGIECELYTVFTNNPVKFIAWCVDC
jgi:hypothetical protein